MDPAWEPVRVPGRRRLWKRTAPLLAGALREHAGELATAMAEQIRVSLPELIADPEDAEANRASNEATLLAMAAMLERGADPSAAELPEQTRGWAIASARQGRSLPGLMRIYRIGHAHVWNWVLGWVRAEVTDPDDFALIVELLSEWMLAYVDILVVLAEDVYGGERERWLRSSSAIRTETINAILAGDPVDPEAASRRLGYELGRHHLALVAWRAEAPGEPERFGELDDAIRDLTASIGAGKPLVNPVGALRSNAWIGSDTPIDAGALDLVRIDAGAGIRVAAGDPGDGLAGFRRSHEEAVAARRVALLGDLPPGAVLRYPKIAFAATASGDLAETWRFVQRQVGVLAAEDQTSVRLLDTLRAYLGAGCSAGRAATQLEIHENTVRYRVRQCEDRLGRTIGPEDFDLHAALVLVATIPALLGDHPPALFGAGT